MSTKAKKRLNAVMRERLAQGRALKDFHPQRRYSATIYDETQDSSRMFLDKKTNLVGPQRSSILGVILGLVGLSSNHREPDFVDWSLLSDAMVQSAAMAGEEGAIIEWHRRRSR